MNDVDTRLFHHAARTFQTDLKHLHTSAQAREGSTHDYQAGVAKGIREALSLFNVVFYRYLNEGGSDGEA